MVWIARPQRVQGAGHGAGRHRALLAVLYDIDAVMGYTSEETVWRRW